MRTINDLENNSISAGRVLEAMEKELPWARAHILIVGQGQVGKSSLNRSLRDQKFDPKIAGTIVADNDQQDMKLQEQHDAKDEDTNSDIHGEGDDEEEGESLNPKRGRDSDEGQVYIHDMELKMRGAASFLRPCTATRDHARGIAGDLRKRAKNDAKSRHPPDDEASVASNKATTKAAAAGAKHTKADAKAAAPNTTKTRTDNTWANLVMKNLDPFDLQAAVEEETIRLKVCDVGGQKVFYNAHSLLLDRCGFYVIVFSLIEWLDNEKEARAYLQFWLESLDTHARGAPFVIVGTKADLFKEKLQKQNACSEKGLKKIYTQRLEEISSEIHQMMRATSPSFLQNRHLIRRAKGKVFHFFPVDNTKSGTDKKDKNILRILKGMRDKILGYKLEGEEKAMVEKLYPCPWMRVCDVITDPKAKSHVAFEEVKRLGALEGVLYEEEARLMLTKFHQIGAVLYFSESENLRRFVICNPQWIVDQIKKFVREERLHGKPIQFSQQRECEEWDSFCKSGFIAEGLLHLLLEHEPSKLETKAEREFVIDILEKYKLMCPCEKASKCSKDPGSLHRVYIVPSMLPEATEPFQNPKGMHKLSLRFKRYIPHCYTGVFIGQGVTKFNQINSKTFNCFSLCKNRAHLQVIDKDGDALEVHINGPLLLAAGGEGQDEKTINVSVYASFPFILKTCISHSIPFVVWEIRCG